MGLESWSLNLGTWTLELESWYLVLGPWNLNLGFWTLEFKFYNFDLGILNLGPLSLIQKSKPMGLRDLWTRYQRPVNRDQGSETKDLWTRLNKIRSFIEDLTICYIDLVTSIKYVYGAEIYICNFYWLLVNLDFFILFFVDQNECMGWTWRVIRTTVWKGGGRRNNEMLKKR